MELSFLGNLLIEGEIKLLTGLMIGGQQGGLEIGGLDNPVVKDAMGRPYIPGSSVKGKLRSLSERVNDLQPNHRMGNVRIHLCQRESDYVDCPTCQIFGIPGESFSSPTRLAIRDSHLILDSISGSMQRHMDLPYTEAKSENAIDRITSQAMPRQFERVPAGAQFEMSMVLSLYTDDDYGFLRRVISLLRLLEDDALGASGSRGYGRVRFNDLSIVWRSREDYLGSGKGTVLCVSEPDIGALSDEADQLEEALIEQISAVSS